ncbi:MULTISPECIES: Bax inhibitor-1/YccA family protein [Succinivibrio]|uniref:Bax inhibitor-1/YccA family protein n=1 Tax=Succinivibrio faecicola TaxID=2820300 RepID=A0ABS7DE79_9GAMM|nr:MULTISPECIES: Bax inhibitor-1/YccA family protein [Succinivibrio]MBW7569604.1 Bax inhibitor-1/YccA family protein [Succinivibrio faecicola]MCI6938957.1 Bax inhibitor-1/YccA family protein [Succinatimonas hippei]MDD6206268.1 Bax inhibitor-1/YccA family protein [Succinivibrio sp.]
MQSSNPAISVIGKTAGYNFGGTAEQTATIQGTTTKSIILVAVTLIIGYMAMNYSLGQLYYYGKAPTFLMGFSVIAAFIVSLVTIFKPTTAPITAPIYAVLEGVGLGTISSLFEAKAPGIVTTAVMSTFVVVMTMLFLWKYKIIVPTQRFKSIIMGAVAGIFVLYILNMVFVLFGSALIPTSGPLSILISLIVCAVAAFSLILDFDAIQCGVDQGLPKYFEYYNAFSLLVTICWLYIEILKLLSKREN